MNSIGIAIGLIGGIIVGDHKGTIIEVSMRIKEGRNKTRLVCQI